ncbi:gamma-tubulin complex component 5 isoform X1 [Olea europaea subsp. europaea]|uniref:Gamma-tubulin complex component n=1 Tax=Olea europaea subsp. europaea TaxID=158383 RepID=A0A8S0TEK3_OLEEU|nr:gamma-tubulin complex component 5 isoform X1 [Olea europaea subsp. europaea]
MIQVLSSSLFYWDDNGHCFRVKSGIYLTHLSQTSLYGVLHQFTYAATSLKLVEIVVNKIEKSKRLPPPTLRAFACAVSTWLRRIWDISLKEEVKINSSDVKATPTLLEPSSSLSSLCSEADYLFQIVHGAIPQYYFELDHCISAAEIAVHIINHLYVELNEVCLLQGGEEDGYVMLLYILVGSLLPYIEGLDSWLFEGTLDDPFKEMFFYANEEIAIDEAEFWEKSYLPRSAISQKVHFLKFATDLLPSTKEKRNFGGRESISLPGVTKEKESNENTFQLCPFFMKDTAKAIISAGKSLQLIQHAPMTPLLTAPATNLENEASLTGLTLSEVVSLVALIADGEHISGYLWNDNRLDSSFGFVEEIQRLEERDGTLPAAIFGENCRTGSAHKSTDYTSGFQFGEFEGNVEDREMLKLLLPFPALLPLFQEDMHMLEVLPFQNNSTLPSRILSLIHGTEPKSTRSSCCNSSGMPYQLYQKAGSCILNLQTDHIGENMLSKLLHDWRLLDELDVLRAIYLLGSVIFTKLDKGESLDDDFKLNTILQESIRNSADNVLLRTPDSLVVSMTKNPGSSEDDNLSVSTPRKGRSQSFGIDVFDSLKFSYKIAWPLELIANLEAMKKYNQVMIFLLKVKRAKFVLDKARRCMWKDRGTATTNCKSHWLLEQKLHFVDAFHQYVMDRVYHNAWHELFEHTTVAETLDEAIELIDSCMQLGLIASCINNIFGLALDFYSVQQNLSSGGAISAIKAKCDKEVYWIEKQFDDCMAFLLRILSVKLNVRQFPYLAALGTHINYNYYHMSKSRFLTASSSRNLHST